MEAAVFVRARITRAAALTDDRKRLITRPMAGKSHLSDPQESEAHTPAANALLFDFSAIAYVRTTVFSFSRLTRHFRSTSARPEHPPWFIYRRARLLNRLEMQQKFIKSSILIKQEVHVDNLMLLQSQHEMKKLFHV